MNVTLKHLKAFVAISETGSFADAADLVHCSQPALSVTIKNLELEIGGRLFTRTTRSLALTPEGRAFLPIAQRLIKDWNYALGDLKDRFALNLGKLSIAAIPSFACDHLPDVLSLFKKRFPDISISVDDVITEAVVEQVHNGRVEVGITFEPSDTKGLNFHPLFQDSFLALLPQDHALNSKDEIQWDELLSNDFITLQSPSSVRHLIDQQLALLDLSVQPAFETHQLSTIARLVSTGLGVSIVPSLSARQMEALGAVCRPLSPPNVIRQIGILTRSRMPLSIASMEIIRILKNHKWRIPY
jgi:LysR family transcriptional regulator, carnitine catabolism transcriptional activator